MEGPTDEDALAAKFTKLVAEHGIEFDVLHTDITADEGMTANISRKKLKRRVGNICVRTHF